MRQIENMVQMITRIIFKKDNIAYEYIDESNYKETNLLYIELLELLNLMKINEAENLLFERIKTDDWNYLEIAVEFYNGLNKLSNDQLEKEDFSRQEIKSGLEDVLKMFNITL